MRGDQGEAPDSLSETLQSQVVAQACPINATEALGCLQNGFSCARKAPTIGRASKLRCDSRSCFTSI